MFLYDLMVSFANWAWGLPMLIWLVGGGIILTIATGGIQFRRLLWILKNTIFKKMVERATRMVYPATLL